MVKRIFCLHRRPELWFASLEQCLAERRPAAREAGLALPEDERRFIDLSCSPLFFANEPIIHPHPRHQRN